MAEKTIMLCCSAGMSTSLLVTKMQKAAEDQGKDVEIFACPAAEADDNLAQNKIDCYFTWTSGSLYGKRI